LITEITCSVAAFLFDDLTTQELPEADPLGLPLESVALPGDGSVPMNSND
jgi:hypothetical protein